MGVTKSQTRQSYKHRIKPQTGGLSEWAGDPENSDALPSALNSGSQMSLSLWSPGFTRWSPIYASTKLFANIDAAGLGTTFSELPSDLMVLEVEPRHFFFF